MVITVSQAIEKFNRYIKATGKSVNTIADYNNSYRKLMAYFEEDPPLPDLTVEDLEGFFADLQSVKHAPAGVAPRPAKPLSDKTIKNIHTALSSLWNWAQLRKFADENIVRQIKVNKPQQPVIEVFTQEQVQSLLDACKHSAAWNDKPDTRNQRPTGLVARDRALVVFLVDTGVRASELCALTIGDIAFETRSAKIRPPKAKNKKPRVVQFGRRVARMLLEYLDIRPYTDPDLPLFSNTDRSGMPSDDHMDRRALAKHLKRLGKRAGISGVYPHRFRHTFATEYIRRGGDIFTLQKLLGHASLDMVMRYLHLVKADVAAAHRRSSPADGWKLK
jgi:integrase/recombinase XerD